MYPVVAGFLCLLFTIFGGAHGRQQTLAPGDEIHDVPQRETQSKNASLSADVPTRIRPSKRQGNVATRDGLYVDGVSLSILPDKDTSMDWSSNMWTQSAGLHGKSSSSYSVGVAALRTPLGFNSYEDTLQNALTQNDLPMIQHLLSLGKAGFEALQTKRRNIANRLGQNSPDSPPSDGKSAPQNSEKSENNTDLNRRKGVISDSEDDDDDGFTVKGRMGVQRSRKCCKCPYNPDARWPIVGSPLLSSHLLSSPPLSGESPEYQWGQKGEPEERNPVGRKNQPRPECCPCEDSDSSDAVRKTVQQPHFRFPTLHLGDGDSTVTLPLTPQAALAAADRGDSPWREIADKVRAEAQVRRVLAYGDTMRLQASNDASLITNSSIQRYHELLARAITISKVAELVAQRAVEKFHSEFWHPASSAGVIGPSKITAAQFPRSNDSDHPVLVRDHMWHGGTRVNAAGITSGLAGHLCSMQGNAGCAQDLTSQDQALEEHYMSDYEAPSTLRALDYELPDEVVHSFKLLSRGAAASTCIQLGVFRCTMTIQEAVSANDTTTLHALRSLLAGTAGDHENAGRLRHLEARATHAREAFQQAVEQAQPSSFIKQLEQNVREADAAFAMENEWHRKIWDMTRLPTIHDFDHSLANTHRDGSADDGSLPRKLWHSISAIYLASPSLKQKVIVDTCGVAHEQFLAVYAVHPDDGKHTAEVPAFTLECLCAAVGERRCTSGLVRAYLHNDNDVVDALRLLHAGHIDGPAEAFCKALGPRCLQVVDGADATTDADVMKLWHFLHGQKRDDYMASLIASLVDVNRQSVSLHNDLHGAFTDNSRTNAVAWALRSFLQSNKNISMWRNSDVALFPFFVDENRSHAMNLTLPLHVSYDNESIFSYLARAVSLLHSVGVPLDTLISSNSSMLKVPAALSATAGAAGAPSPTLKIPKDSEQLVRERAKLLQSVKEDHERLRKDEVVDAIPTLLRTDGIRMAVPSRQLRVLRAGVCAPNHNMTNKYDCLDFEGSCSVLRQGFNSSVYAAYWRKLNSPSGVQSGIELPPDASNADLAAQQMAVGGSNSMSARNAEGAKAPDLSGLTVGAGGAGGLTDEQRRHPSASGGSIADAVRSIQDDPRAAKSLPAQSVDEDPMAGIFAESDESLAALPVIRSRTECEGTVDTASLRRGVWRPRNTWFPYAYPHALTAAIRSGSYKAVRDILISDVAHANMLLVPEVHGDVVPCTDPRLCKSTVDASGTVVVDSVTPDGRVVEVHERCLGMTPNPTLLLGASTNGLELEYIVPNDGNNYGRDSAIMPGGVRSFATSSLGCSAAYLRPLDVLLGMAAGEVSTLGPCVFNGSCTAGSTHRREMPSAEFSSISRLLISFGAESAYTPRSLGIRWMALTHEGEQYEDLTLGNLGHGRYGLIDDTFAPPWWECKSRTDGTGCLIDADAAGSGLLCDPDTGEGCECDEQEAPSSDMVCDAATRRKRRRVIVVTTTTYNMQRNARDASGKINKGSGKASSSKRCDPNPFTNLLFFIFCIIMLIIEAIMKAIFGFLEIGGLGTPHFLGTAHGLNTSLSSTVSPLLLTMAWHTPSAQSAILLRPGHFKSLDSAFLGVFAPTLFLDQTQLVRDEPGDSPDFASVTAGLSSLASGSQQAADLISKEEQAYAGEDSAFESTADQAPLNPSDIINSGDGPPVTDADEAVISAAVGKPPRASAPRNDDNSCDCFCPRDERTGVLPLPPLSGHVMVTVDDGSTPVIIGGVCAGRNPSGVGDVAYSSKVYYMRVGRGNDFSRAKEIKDRILQLQGVAPVDIRYTAPAAMRASGRNAGPLNFHPRETASLQQSQLSFLERQDDVVSKNTFMEEPQQQRSVEDVYPDSEPDDATEAYQSIDVPDPEHVEITATMINGLGVALREVLHSRFEPLTNLSKTGHTWFEVGQPPFGINMQRIFGTSRGQFVHGTGMHPRTGHSASVFSRNFGDGGDFRKFLQSSRQAPRQKYSAEDWMAEEEILWPRETLRGVPIASAGAKSWGATRFDWTNGKDEYYKSLSQLTTSTMPQPSGTAPMDEHDVWRHTDEKDEKNTITEERSDPQSLGGVWLPVQAPVDKLTASDWDARRFPQYQNPIVPPSAGAAAAAKGEWSSARFGPQLAKDLKLEGAASKLDGIDSRYRAANLENLEKQAYVGYELNATRSLFDAIIIFGGYNGDGDQQSYYSDVWIMYRFASKLHERCAEPGSDGYQCADPGAAVKLHYAKTPVAYRLIAGRVARRDTAPPSVPSSLYTSGDHIPVKEVPGRRKRETAFGVPMPAALLEVEGPSLLGFSGLDFTVDLKKVDPVNLIHHLRDPTHYAWTWKWRNVGSAGENIVKNAGWRHLGAPNQYGASPRAEHTSSTIAAEIMFIIGGKGPDVTNPIESRPGMEDKIRFFSDIYALHAPTLTWLDVRISGSSEKAFDGEKFGFTPRAGHTATVVGPHIYIFGGYGSGSSLFGDMWKLDTKCHESWRSDPAEAASNLYAKLGKVYEGATNVGYDVPLPIQRRQVRCVDTEGRPVSLLTTSVQSPIVVQLVKLRPLGFGPSPRFGHAAMLLGSKLVFFGGYAAGSDHGSWRNAREFAGLRMDSFSMEMPIPVISSISPSSIPASGCIDRALWPAETVPDASQGSCVPLRVTIKGRNFGTCRSWVSVDGMPMCNATCNVTSGGCKAGDALSWVDNNRGEIAKISIAGALCHRIIWHSPNALSCAFARIDAPLDESLGVVITMANGLSSVDAAMATSNPSASTSTARFRGGRSTGRKGLFWIREPRISFVTPPKLVDAPGRGPLVIVGNNFGTREWYVPAGILAAWKAASAEITNASSTGPMLEYAPLPNGGTLMSDGSIVFDHNAETLATSVFSRFSGTDGANATSASLPLVLWVGRRPCLRVVWFSDNLVTCECVQRNRRDDVSVTRDDAAAMLWNVAFTSAEITETMFVDGRSYYLHTQKLYPLLGTNSTLQPSVKEGSGATSFLQQESPSTAEMGELSGAIGGVANAKHRAQHLSSFLQTEVPEDELPQPEILQRMYTYKQRPEATSVFDGVQSPPDGPPSPQHPRIDAQYKAAMLAAARQRRTRLKESPFPLDDLTDLLGGLRPMRVDAGQQNADDAADARGRMFSAFVPPWVEDSIIIYVYGRKSRAFPFQLVPASLAPVAAGRSAIPFAKSCPSLRAMLPLRALLGVLVANLDGKEPTPASAALISSLTGNSSASIPPLVVAAKTHLRGAPKIHSAAAKALQDDLQTARPVQTITGSDIKAEASPTRKGQVATAFITMEETEGASSNCSMRVTALESKFSLPAEYFDYMSGTTVSGKVNWDSHSAANGDYVSPGCGCGPLLSDANSKITIKLEEVPASCKAAVEAYGWRLGCDELRWQFHTLCEHSPWAKKGAGDRFSSVDTMLSGIGFSAAGADDAKLRGVADQLARLMQNANGDQCGALRNLVTSHRCRNFPADWLSNVVALKTQLLEKQTQANGSAEARFRVVAEAENVNSKANPRKLPSKLPGMHNITVGRPGTSALLWDSASALCGRGQPASPRRNMATALLADGVTVVAYGGLVEGSPSAYAGSDIGPATPQTQVSANDTYFIQIIPEDEYSKFDLYPFGCDADTSDEVAALQALPTRKLDSEDPFARSMAEVVGDF